MSSHGGKREGAGKPKGQARPPGSGRQKGTPNKDRALFADLVREEIGVDAIVELCRRYKSACDDFDNPQRADKLIAEITSYCVPKPKAIEHSFKEGESGGAIVVARIDIDERAKQLKGDK